ncbi:MAG: hypothetical protein L0241_25075, partial [Planctomycetia bacterium]|nr:hypothetical protein [Planctomycetia bacterium]
GAVAGPSLSSTSASPNTTLQSWITDKGATEAFCQFQELATEIFPQGTEFAFSLESDPDSEDDSVVCIATLPSGQPGKALSYYDQFVAKWARRPDPEHTGLFTLLVR